MALRAKIGSYEAESEDFGGSKIEGDNEGWPDFRRSPYVFPERVVYQACNGL
jgi:hypothetical protein